MPRSSRIGPLALVAALTVAVSGCASTAAGTSTTTAHAVTTSSTTAATAPSPAVLVDFEAIEEVSARELRTRLRIVTAFDLAEEVEYDATVYRLRYLTTYLGESVVASGLAVVPDTNDPVAIVAHQQGTEIEKADAPSVTGDPGEIEAAAAMGALVLVADYLGFGASADLVHPYHHRETTVSALRDLLAAGTELAAELGVDVDGRLFATGYSQGAWATMQLVASLVAEPMSGVEVAAVSVGSGAYDLEAVAKAILTQNAYSRPVFFAYLGYAWVEVGALPGPLDRYFQEPYASQIPDWFHGDLSSRAINNRLPERLGELLVPGLDEGGLPPQLRSALAANSVPPFSTAAPLRMSHGTADETVPFSTAREAFAALQTAADEPDTLVFVEYGGFNHALAFLPHLLDTMRFFVEQEL